MIVAAKERLEGLQREEIEKYVYNHVFLDDVIKIDEEEYTIDHFYPNFVMCKRKNGSTESFQYVEIMNAIGATVETVLAEIQVAS